MVVVVFLGSTCVYWLVRMLDDVVDTQSPLCRPFDRNFDRCSSDLLWNVLGHTFRPLYCIEIGVRIIYLSKLYSRDS